MLFRWTAITSFLTSAMSVLASDSGQYASHLERGAPILGTFKPSHARTAHWMASISDSKAVEKLNIPGTHDAAAWNYTGVSKEWYNCQAHPLFDQLDGGIRLFDLRFGWLENKLVFYHADALLSDTAQLEDIFWGFYKWLDAHPTEALFVSLKVDNGPNDANLQQAVYGLLTSAQGKKYWVQKSGTLGTLGGCRKKITLLRRFGWTLNATQHDIGINLSSGWADNLADFSINYVTDKSAYIEDYYEIGGDPSDQHKITEKFNATIMHIDQARSTNPSQLYISFASGAGMRSLNETGTPEVLAVGTGVTTAGVNQLLLAALRQRKGGRFGMVLLDFFDSIPGVVEAIVGLY